MFDLLKKLFKNVLGFFTLGNLGGLYQLTFIVFTLIVIYKIYCHYKYSRRIKLDDWGSKIYKTNSIGFKY